MKAKMMTTETTQLKKISNKQKIAAFSRKSVTGGNLRGQ